jgi:hypothetical protein
VIGAMLVAFMSEARTGDAKVMGRGCPSIRQMRDLYKFLEASCVYMSTRALI